MNEDYFFQPHEIGPEDGPLLIEELSAEPYPDGRRIKVSFRLSGSRKSLACSICLQDQAGQELVSTNIVNLFNPHQEVTLHLPKSRIPLEPCSLSVTLFTLEEVESKSEPGKVGAIESKTLDSKSLNLILSEQ